MAKPGIAVMLGMDRPPKHEEEPEGLDPSEIKEHLMEASEELIEAVHSKDKMAVYKALCAFLDLHEEKGEEPEEEEHEEEAEPEEEESEHEMEE